MESERLNWLRALNVGSESFNYGFSHVVFEVRQDQSILVVVQAKTPDIATLKDARGIEALACLLTQLESRVVANDVLLYR